MYQANLQVVKVSSLKLLLQLMEGMLELVRGATFLLSIVRHDGLSRLAECWIKGKSGLVRRGCRKSGSVRGEVQLCRRVAGAAGHPNHEGLVE